MTAPAEPASASVTVRLTPKGERYTREHAEALARHNRLTIGREIDKLLAIRRQADDLAAHLIGMLDMADGDPDLDENGDEQDSDAESEPSLGWNNNAVKQDGVYWRGSDSALGVDLEDEHDGRENGGDTEPNGDEQDTNQETSHNPYPTDEFGNTLFVGNGERIKQWWQEPSPNRPTR